MIAHVSGVPVEEALLPLASWAGVGLLLARSWVASHVRSKVTGRFGPSQRTRRKNARS